MRQFLSDLVQQAFTLAPSTIFGAAVGSTATYIIKIYSDRRRDYWFERHGFIEECIDLQRHLVANKIVVEEMIANFYKSQNMTFRRIHIQRLALLKESTTFSLANYRNFPGKYVKIIHRQKLILRNIELDVMEAIRIGETEEYEELYLFLNFLIKRLYVTARSMATFTQELRGEKKDKKRAEEALAADEAAQRLERTATDFAYQKVRSKPSFG